MHRHGPSWVLHRPLPSARPELWDGPLDVLGLIARQGHVRGAPTGRQGGSVRGGGGCVTEASEAMNVAPGITTSNKKLGTKVHQGC